jgi:cell division protein FtsL
MTRVNFILLAALVACALSVVTSQHRARKLFIALQQQQEQSHALDVEWGQLQLEQRTWATPSRIEKVAHEQMRMRVPESARTRVLSLPRDKE